MFWLPLGNEWVLRFFLNVCVRSRVVAQWCVLHGRVELSLPIIVGNMKKVNKVDEVSVSKIKEVITYESF